MAAASPELTNDGIVLLFVAIGKHEGIWIGQEFSFIVGIVGCAWDTTNIILLARILGCEIRNKEEKGRRKTVSCFENEKEK